MYYIAYGSNLNLEQMSYRCPTAKVIGSTVIDGYRLLFQGYPGHAVATIEKKNGETVPALVWDIKPADERALDRYEGWPKFYRKEMMTVCINDRPLEAMVYIMNGARPIGAPSRAYLDTILQGYVDAVFDVEGLIEKQ